MAAIFITACASCAPAAGPRSTSTTTSTTPGMTTTAAVASGVPPDMLNPAVTVATVMTTICADGYTSTIRPPTSFTEPLKFHQIVTYGYADRLAGDYEDYTSNPGSAG